MADPKPKMTLPRAYLRMSPNLDQHPDPEGMVLLLCAAHRQPQRGRFRDRSVMSRALGSARLKRFLARGDVVAIGGGGWMVEGWDEWQEGDLTVGERQRRIRDRRRNEAVTGGVTEPLSDRDSDVTPSRPDNADVTSAALPDRNSPSEAVDVRLSRDVDEGLTRPSTEQGARAISLGDPRVIS